MATVSTYTRRRFVSNTMAGVTAMALVPLSPFVHIVLANGDVAASPMAAGRPSVTAQGAAQLRAVHQVLDAPPVFADPHALGIVGSNARQDLQTLVDRYQASLSLRAYVALRSRYAEDRVAQAVSRGIGQYVLLGAGLDTFAWRNPHPGLRVFEVDHPSTQAWKKQRLREAGLPTPGALTFAPVDFERQTLADGLRAAGFDATAPVIFSMLGVVVYLTRDALMETLRFAAAMAPGSEIVFSYSVPPELLSEAQRAARAISAQRVAAIGEPWISYYHPGALAADVKALGFGEVLNLAPAEANERYFKARADALRVSGGAQLMTARV